MNTVIQVMKPFYLADSAEKARAMLKHKSLSPKV